MSNLFRTNAGRTAPVQPDTQLRIQSSVQGLPRPIGYGQTRTSGNLIWYGDFRAIAQQQQASGSGGKGSIFSTAGSSATNYIYQASVAIALSEGPITNVLQAFINNLSNTLAQLNLTLFNGSYSQSAWGYLTTVHPSQALNYRGISYVAAGPYQLGNTASLPNISFEVQFAINTGVSGVPDADPGACIIDFLTNPFYGVGFPPASVGPLTTYSNYCKATGMLISDCITQRAAASDWIKNLLKATNSDAVFSQGVLNIVPYGDQGYTAGTSYTITETHILSSIGVPGVPTISSITVGAPGNFISSGGVVYTTTNTPLTFVGSVPAITGAGLFTQSGSTYWFSTADGGQSITITYTYTAAASYSPPANPIYALTDDDFLDTGATNTAGTAIQATRTRQSDQINNIKVEYFDRSNNYNPAVAEAMDDGSITLYGKRSGDTRQSHFFCTGTAAQQSANLELGRQYIRTTYKFTLGAKYILLDPMDVVSITDSALGLNQQWVRIKEIQENSDLTLTITAEEYLNGTGAAPLYSPSIPGGFNLNYNIQPGNVNAPIFIEPTIDLAGTLEIWLAISGSVPANWGGCEIWLSFDNSTYALIGIQSGPSRMGVLTGNLATLAGTGETQDNTNVLAVDLTESQSQLSSGTAQDMLEGITLCYVDGEFLSYEFAALNSAYHYSLNPLFRGLYNTWQVMNSVTHLTGSSFVRCDSGIFQYPYDPTKIGSTVYVKFLSFNPYGFGKQALSDVSPYTHTIVGVNQGITTVPGFSVSAITVTGSNGVSTPGILCNWTPIHNSTIVSVIVEYYPFVGGVGQSTQITFNDPASGAGTIAGLQALTLYEVRATIVTNPNTLPTSWTTYQAVTTPDTLVIHLGPDAAPDVPTGLTLSNIAAVTGSEGTVTGGISASWNNVTSPTFQAYYARLSIDGGTHWLSQATGLPTASWSSLPIGATATVQIASVSRLGSTSAFTASQALTVSGTATNPGAPTITSAIGGFKSVLLTWTNNPPNADYAYTEIWSSQTNNLSTAILEGTAKGTSWTTTGSGWFTGLSIYWWLRNVNTSNLASGYSSGQFSGFLTTTIPITGNPDIAARTIIADRIGVGQITATEIAAATITGDRIAAGTITAATGNIGNLAVDTLQINNAAVTIPVFHTESPGVIWNGVAQFFTPVTITVTLPPFDSATAMVQVIFQITQTLSNVSAFGNIYVSSDGINYSLVASTSNSGQIGNTVALSTSVFGSNPNNFPLSLTLYVKPAFQGTASQGSTISVSVTILGVKR